MAWVGQTSLGRFREQPEQGLVVYHNVGGVSPPTLKDGGVHGWLYLLSMMMTLSCGFWEIA